MFDIKVPFPIMADAYTIASDAFASPACKELSVYNLINRKSPQSAWPDVAKDSRMVLYGVSHYIRSHLMTPVTKDDVYESMLFMQDRCSFGGPLHFPLEMWDAVVNDYNGYLPIEIKALKEGSTFFPYIPMVEVKNTAAGFGELAVHIEATMLGMVSLATARATFTRHWLNQLLEWVRKDLPTDSDEVLYKTAQWMIHDFGMRASAVPEESLLFGLAHLLSFHGTDTFNAAYVAKKLGAKPMTGTSILASAHHSVQGYETEAECHDAVHRAGKRYGGITSNVSDCYNFFESVSANMVRLADKYPDSITVARPDSGDALQNILFILKQGRKNLRYIEGNGQKPKSMFAVLQGIADAGYKATQHGIFGVGGELRNTCTRDSMSSKWALTNAGNRPVVKCSEELGKRTIPGPNVVIRRETGMTTHLSDEFTKFGGSCIVANSEGTRFNDELRTYYSANKDGMQLGHHVNEKFAVQQDRCIEDFDSWRDFAAGCPTYGLNGSSLSENVIRVQDEICDKYNVRKEA